jgi:hypothetical protein
MKYISPLISQASASLGGATFSKNRGGNYVRAKVAPVQPRTVAQQSVRANLATLAQTWKSLSSEDVAAWNSAASSVTLKDSLGNAYTPSGIDLFISCNRNLSDIGETSINTPAAQTAAFDDLSPLTLTMSAGTPTFTIVPTIAAAPTGFKFLVRATAQVSSGKSYFSPSALRNIESFAATSYASLNLLAAYTARFGALVEGQQVKVAVSLVQIASGYKSLEFTATGIVGA